MTYHDNILNTSIEISILPHNNSQHFHFQFDLKVNCFFSPSMINNIAKFDSKFNRINSL